MSDNQTPLTVLTRNAESNRNWATIFAKHGLPTYDLPCIQFKPVPKNDQQSTILKRLPKADWLIFTSVQGVKFFVDNATQYRLDRHTLATLRLAAVGHTTADAITAHGLVVTFTPTKPDAITLGRELPNVKDRTCVLVSSNLSDPALPEALQKRGGQILVLTLYKNVPITTPNPHYEQLLIDGRIGSIVFASPSAIKAYLSRLGPVAHIETLKLQVIAIGPTTAQTALENGFKIVTQSFSPSVDQVMKLLNYKL